MRLFFITLSFLSSVGTQLHGQCKEIKQSLRVLNETLLDSSIALLDQAEVVIKENGLETVDEKCMAKYYYTRGITQLMLGKKTDSLDQKAELLGASGENYLMFLKQPDRPSELESNVKSNLVSLAVEYGNLGVLCYQQADYNRAFAFVEKGMELKNAFGQNEISEQDYYNALVCSKIVGSNEKAIAYSDSLLSSKNLSNNKRIKYLCQKAEVLINMKNLDSAKTVISELRTLDSTDLSVRNVNLQFLVAKDDFQGALTELDVLSRKDNKRVALLVLKGQILHKLEKDSLSQISFVEALALDSMNSAARYGLGALSVSHANNYIKASLNSDDALKAQNDSLAELKFQMAIQQFEKIPASDQKYLDALTALKAVYESLGNEAKVEEIISRIADL